MIGERLADLRRDKSLSQKVLANARGLSFYTISSLGREKRAPDDDMKVKIA